MDLVKRTIKLLYTAALITCCAVNILGQSRKPEPRDDTQVWPEVQIALPLRKKVDLVVSGILYIGRNVSHLVNEQAGVAFSFKPNKYLTLSPGYRSIATQPVPNRSGREKRFSFAGTVNIPLEPFTLSNRHLIERRLRHPQADSTRCRNRLQIEYPIKLRGLNLQLFAYDEVFYDWAVNDWSRSGIAIGCSRKFNQHFTGDLFYIRQNDGYSRPGDLHVVGTVLRIRL